MNRWACLTFETSGVRGALPASVVRRIVSVDDWAETPTFTDVDFGWAALGTAAPKSVLLLELQGRYASLGVRGDLAAGEYREDTRLGLDSEFFRASAFSHALLERGAVHAFLIDVARVRLPDSLEPVSASVLHRAFR